MSERTIGRRRLLGGLGALAAAGVAGCTDDTVGGDPHYENGSVEDVEGEQRSPEELTAAESLAEEESHEGATPIEAIAITDHEFVLEDDVRGPTVQGTVANEGDDRVELVEVRVRIYDADGDQLGRFLDSTGDLDGGASWSFEVVLLESPGEIADYDVTAVGTPA